MRELTTKAWQDWYEAQPEHQECRRCPAVGSKASIQPQWDFRRDRAGDGALCTDCITALNREADVRRKAVLAGLPRCEVCVVLGRKKPRRGSWNALTTDGSGLKVLMCGEHLKAAKRGHARTAGSIWLPGPPVTAGMLKRFAGGE